MINKDTKIFCSFSSNPGNNGCVFFNDIFKKNKINAIYKSFYSDNIAKSFEAAKNLNFSGFAISMPFKFEILGMVDRLMPEVEEIKAANTVIFKDGISIAYNTDWIAVKNYLKDFDKDYLKIAGNGGFGKAVQYACKDLNIKFDLITRENWDELDNHDQIVFNATPTEIERKNIIDGRPHTKSGKEMALLQAKEQYQIYYEHH